MRAPSGLATRLWTKSEEDAIDRKRIDRGAAFETLLKELVEIICRSGKKLNEEELSGLNKGMDNALFFYGFLRLYKPFDLHRIAKPLARVIKELKRKEYEPMLIRTLGPAGWVGLEDPGALRVTALIADLERLLERHGAPQRRKRARPGNLDLHYFVHLLARVWHSVTSRPFTQEWHGKEPVSPGAQFAHAVVSYIDAASLAATPKMTERVVAERRKGIGPRL
jgi:hypothetical protein